MYVDWFVKLLYIILAVVIYKVKMIRPGCKVTNSIKGAASSGSLVRRNSCYNGILHEILNIVEYQHAYMETKSCKI